MTRVLKGFHSFTRTHRVHPLTEWTTQHYSYCTLGRNWLWLQCRTVSCVPQR